MRQNWFCASLIALVALALPSPATARPDLLSFPTRQADCDIILAGATTDGFAIAADG